MPGALAQGRRPNHACRKSADIRPAAPEPLAIVLPHLVVRSVAAAPGKQTTRTVAEAYLAAHTVSVREVERSTGLDPLPKLDAEALKQAVASELWPRN